jgi:hypothetical protein
MNIKNLSFKLLAISLFALETKIFCETELPAEQRQARIAQVDLAVKRLINTNAADAISARYTAHTTADKTCHQLGFLKATNAYQKWIFDIEMDQITKEQALAEFVSFSPEEHCKPRHKQ